MSDRMTRERLEERCANVNRRLAANDSKYRYEISARNGHIALDRVIAIFSIEPSLWPTHSLGHGWD